MNKNTLYLFFEKLPKKLKFVLLFIVFVAPLSWTLINYSKHILKPEHYLNPGLLAKTSKKIDPSNLHTVIGKTNPQYINSGSTVSATSISDISGIPRATCIRKLEKLVKLGLLVREIKTKRYYVNQVSFDRTKNIIKKENVISTVKIFSEFLTIIINTLIVTKAQN